MSDDTGPNGKKRTRVLDDLDGDLEQFGSRAPPQPAVVELPGGYKDEANPFNDAQLSAPFQWKLRNQKLAKDGIQTASTAEEEAAQRESTMVRGKGNSGLETATFWGEFLMKFMLNFTLLLLKYTLFTLK